MAKRMLQSNAALREDGKKTRRALCREFPKDFLPDQAVFLGNLKFAHLFWYVIVVSGSRCTAKTKF